MADLSYKFLAESEVALRQPNDVLCRLCDYFRAFGQVTQAGEHASIVMEYGCATLVSQGACLKLTAQSADPVHLGYVKQAMAVHLMRLATGENPRLRWLGDGMAGQPLPDFREMRVLRSENVTPRMRRLTLAGNDLQRFDSRSMHVRLMFPREGIAPCWPVTGEDGRMAWTDATCKPFIRAYTLRHMRAGQGEVDIDFVMHEGNHMPGAGFAMNARPGDVVGMAGPGGGDIPDVDSLILAGDETAIPAIARVLERLRPETQAQVFIEAQTRDEWQPLPSAASATITWLYRDHRAPGQTGALSFALRTAHIPNDGRSTFVWAGCEFSEAAAIRSWAKDERGLDSKQFRAASFWRRGVESTD